ncbi:MAG: hypothetical protein ACRC0S_01030 [Fusobacteriaceae bacterium]
MPTEVKGVEVAKTVIGEDVVLHTPLKEFVTKNGYKKVSAVVITKENKYPCLIFTPSVENRDGDCVLFSKKFSELNPEFVETGRVIPIEELRELVVTTYINEDGVEMTRISKGNSGVSLDGL